MYRDKTCLVTVKFGISTYDIEGFIPDSALKSAWYSKYFFFFNFEKMFTVSIDEISNESLSESIHASLVNHINQKLYNNRLDLHKHGYIYIDLDDIEQLVRDELSVNFYLRISEENIFTTYEEENIEKSYFFYQGYMLPVTNIQKIPFKTSFYYYDKLMFQLKSDIGVIEEHNKLPTKNIIPHIINLDFLEDHRCFIDIEDLLKKSTHLTYLYSR